MGGAGPKRTIYEELEAVPPHLVAEIIGGTLLTHPRPSRRHVTTAIALAVELGGPFQKGRGGPGGWIFADEPELHLGADVLVPDVAGWRVERLNAHPETSYFTVSPDWICEILSASTEKRDRTIKMQAYAEANVPYFWLIDPRQQMLEVFELNEGQWRVAGGWTSADEVRAAPFDAVAFSLADLWPLDKPLGFNEDPQALYAGDR
ncbi:MAG: Uma2 family endonuclease [Devosia sp.]